MELIDTHSHLFTKHFSTDLAEVVGRARAAGVVKVLLPNIDASTMSAVYATAATDPTMFGTMMGLHPCDVREDWRSELDLIHVELLRGGHVAVGEIGLDMYWDKTTIGRQTGAFIAQLRWAKELGLPVAVHCRDAYDQVIECIRTEQDGSLQGVLHCFTGNSDQAQKILDLGLYLGIGGVATYKNGGLDAVLPHVPLHRLLLETDSPYLAPVPHRGKRNESAYLIYVAQKVAEILGLDTDEVARITTENARRLFRLS